MYIYKSNHKNHNYVQDTAIPTFGKITQNPPYS